MAVAAAATTAATGLIRSWGLPPSRACSASICSVCGDGIYFIPIVFISYIDMI
jgi:hypothetical protein